MTSSVAIPLVNVTLVTGELGLLVYVPVAKAYPVMFMAFWPRLLMTKELTEPALDWADGTTRPGKLTCKGLIERMGLLLAALPVTEIGTWVENPATVLFVSKFSTAVWTAGDDVYCVKLKTTGKENVLPVASLVLGRLEF